MIERKCLNCNKLFFVKFNSIRKKYCNNSCAATYVNKNIRDYSFRRDENYIEKEEDRYIKCKYCNKIIYTKTKRRKCCSVECARKTIFSIYNKKRDYSFMKGDNNPAKKYCLGKKLSAKHRIKIGVGVKTSEKYIKTTSSKRYRDNLSKSLKGRNITWGDKMSKTRLKMNLKGKNHPFYGKKHSEKSKRNMSLGQIRKIKEGKIKINPQYSYQGKHKYKDIFMRSSWEVKVAQWLDENSIKWEYESPNCVFKLDNEKHYIIDFFLPKQNKYIEVKGRWDENSIYKYSQAKEKLDICIVDKRNINDINLEVTQIEI